MCGLFRYSHQYSNHLQQRGLKTCMMSSGFLLDTQMTFDKEKRRHVWCLQVFSSIFESPSTERNKDVYDIFRYSHRYSNHLRQRETTICMTSSGILIDIRITFDKEKQGHVWCVQAFLFIFESPSTRRNENMYGVFRYFHQYSNHLRPKINEDMYGVSRYSHLYSNHLEPKETGTCMMFSVIIRNTVLLTLLQK